MRFVAPVILALAAAVIANPMPATDKHDDTHGASDAGIGGGGNGGGGGGGGNQPNQPQPQPGNGGNGGTGGNPQVTEAINKWLADIKAVNTFVDSKLTNPQDITKAATTAFTAAQDEGTQNDALAKLTKLDAAGSTANKNLADQFKIIGPAIQDTIKNPQNYQKNVATINKARCPVPNGNGAITMEGAVMQSAAKSVGTNAPTPTIPTACGAAKGTGAKAENGTGGGGGSTCKGQ